MFWSCPFHSFQLPLHVPVISRYVRFIFHVCPVLSLRVISLHLLSCRLVSLCFVSLSFHLRSPCSVSFMSLSVPLCFPFIVDFLFLPLISLHPVPQKTAFPAFSQRGRPTTQSVFQSFGKRRQETETSKEPAAWDLCFATPAPRRLRGTSSNYRAVCGGPPLPPCTLRIRRPAGRVGGGGGYPLASLRCPTRRSKVGGYLEGRKKRNTRLAPFLRLSFGQFSRPKSAPDSQG